MEYCAFTDESNFTQGRFRSIAVVTHPSEYCGIVQPELKAILGSSGLLEFKWENLRNAKYRFCAEKILDYVFRGLRDYSLRIDVLIWDLQDSRHRIHKRDDLANFERMFYHLLRNALKRREFGAEWRVFPDENLAIDWETVHACLSQAGRWRDLVENTLFGDFISDAHFHILEFKEANSKTTHQCQVADLFAGMAAFSKSHYDGFATWRRQYEQQCALFAEEEVAFSKAENARYEIIHHFSCHCKNRGLGVSIDSKCCLYTFNPKNPINFWHYEPQHDLDKAPTRDFGVGRGQASTFNIKNRKKRT